MTHEATNAEIIPFAVPHDWFLQSLVGIANDGIEFGVTLQVSGLLVSGVLTGGKAYFEGFAEDFASGLNDSKDAESVRSSFAQHGEIYEKSDDAPPPPQYIHLKNARFFNTAGKPIPGNKGVWWRGRISEVAGFTLGSLDQTEV